MDATLMQRVVDGDEDAFAEIVGQYKDSLVNYLTHLTRSRERAEELAQDAFVRLYRNAARYVDAERVGPLLYKIATNLAVSVVRRERRWSLLLPRFQATTSQQSVSPDAGLLSDEVQKNVHAALGQLPLKYRAPLVLFEIEEWSYDEIGRALGLPSGTVKSRIARARERLRSHLAPFWNGGNHERPRAQRVAASASAREGVVPIQL
ncbi:MAG TPA: sigma-70 family RNA polymerase sigma factor [Thermoanaerobaculia bacterium]|nr:sigma-70 family RNA polymerase sigma factor [Thermoanaerobaculia bacterium]